MEIFVGLLLFWFLFKAGTSQLVNAEWGSDSSYEDFLEMDYFSDGEINGR